MTRHARFTLCFFAMLFLAVSLMAAPKLISYQGKATDAAGQPVTDGSHPVIFQIYNKYGSLQWTESASVSTKGGLFSHNLGSVTPINPYVFNWQDSLFLQVTFEGQVLLPRTTFTATPYAYAVNSVDGAEGGVIRGAISVNSAAADDEVAGIALDPSGNPNLWMKDMDGINRVKLDAATRSLEFVDAVVTSTPARITSHGDTLVLGEGKVKIRSNLARVSGQFDVDGTTDCWINPNMTGVSSVYLPDDGINGREIRDEPGVAQAVFDSTSPKHGGSADFIDIVTLTVTIPASGYVLLTGQAAVSGYNGYVQLDDAAGGYDRDITAYYYIPFSGESQRKIHLSRLIFKAAGSHTFRIEARLAGMADILVNEAVLTAVFIPSSYGTVETMVSAVEAGQFEKSSARQLDGQASYKVDLRELELKAAKAEAEAEKAKRELLEAQQEQTTKE